MMLKISDNDFAMWKRREEQRVRNAAEWKRRAAEARSDGNLELARNLEAQALHPSA